MKRLLGLTALALLAGATLASAVTVDFEDDSVIGTSVRDKNAPPAAEPAYDSVYAH